MRALADESEHELSEPGQALRAAARLGRPRPWLLLIALVVLALVIAGVVWWRGQARPVRQPLEVVAPGSPVALPGAAEPSDVPGGASGRVMVDVAGKVARPGVVTLRSGSRVAEAITAAGGLLPGTSTAGVNLARKVNDGEQIVVGTPLTSASSVPSAPTGGDAGSGQDTLDLNTATPEQLDELPRIGPATAAKIVDFRTAHGPFRSVDQLLDVPGIGEATLAGIRDRLRT